jgi:hypothetical protein
VLLRPRDGAAELPVQLAVKYEMVVNLKTAKARERGPKALREPANQERLSRCDAAARTQINERIEKLLAADRIAGEALDA